MSAVNIKFDATELNAAMAKLAVVSDKLPSEIVNQKGFFIFGRAAKNMKVVEKMKIQEELGASPAHVLTLLKNGRYSRAKKNVKMFFGQGAGQTEDFSLLAAIVQSRAKKSGKGSPWKGVDRATGAKQMAEAMAKVYAGRQKSRGYFRRCFQVAREVYRRAKKPTAFKISKLFSFAEDAPGEGSLMERRGKMADVSIAKEGQAKALSTFWVKSTEHDTKDGLDKYAAPVLQAAVDAEAESTFEHEAELEYKAAIKALGIKVS